MQTQKYTAELHVAIQYGEERPQLSNKKKRFTQPSERFSLLLIFTTMNKCVRL